MRTLLVSCLLAAAGLPARGEMLPLPVEAPIEHPTVILDLRDDTLEVVVDDEAEPSLRILDAISGEASEGFVSIEIEETLGSLRVLRPHGDAMTAPPLRIELVVSRTHALELVGAGFDATISDPYIDEDSRRSIAGGVLYKVRADDARVSFRGVRGIELGGSASSFDLSLTASPVEASLESGSLEIEDHLGDIRVVGEQTEVGLTLLRGNVSAQLTGGSLDVREGSGLIRAQVYGGLVRAAGWEGSVSVEGEGALVEVSGAGGEDSLIEVEGLDHALVVDDFRGGVIARLRGGEARLEKIGQRVQVTAAEATRVDIDTVGGKATLRLSDGANAGVARVAGELEASVEDGELVAEEVRDLDLKLTRTRAKLASQAGRVRLRAMDSDVSLNLEGEAGYQPSLEALGSSRVEVSMREPCVISLKGGDEMADLIDAGGCDMRASGRRVSSRRAAGPTTLVTAKVAPGSSIEISSR